MRFADSKQVHIYESSVSPLYADTSGCIAENLNPRKPCGHIATVIIMSPVFYNILR